MALPDDGAARTSVEVLAKLAQLLAVSIRQMINSPELRVTVVGRWNDTGELGFFWTEDNIDSVAKAIENRPKAEFTKRYEGNV